MGPGTDPRPTVARARPPATRAWLAQLAAVWPLSGQHLRPHGRSAPAPVSHRHAVSWTLMTSHHDRSRMAIVTRQRLRLLRRAPGSHRHRPRSSLVAEGRIPKSRRCEERPNQAVGGPHGPTQGLPGRLGSEMYPCTHIEVSGVPSALWLCSHVCHACSVALKKYHDFRLVPHGIDGPERRKARRMCQARC